MSSALHHRGPDEEGFFLDDPVGLAHARLKIIDLHSGRQPIHNEDCSVWVVCNGEIFNFPELRRGLEQRGHRFYTTTDTEVIVHLYEEEGLDFVDQLNGQFAICLWDATEKKLILARDRVGIIPLFFADSGKRMIFASEVKAILRAGVAASLDPSALLEMLHWWTPLSPRTIFQGIQEVPPGHLAVWSQGAREVRQYWDWTFPDEGEFLPGDATTLGEELIEILRDATRIRLRADVGVGAYLSGGVDSSAIVAMIRSCSSDTLNTFSLGFEENRLDERRYQQTIAAHFGTRHHQTICKSRQIPEEFLSAVWHAETPLIRTAPVPMGILASKVRDAGCKVALTGEGSDEILGGYDIFKETKIREFCGRDPSSPKRPRLFTRLYPYLKMPRGDGTILRSVFGTRVDPLFARIQSHRSRCVSTAQTARFFSRDLLGAGRGHPAETFAATLPPDFDRWHSLNRAQYIEAKTLTSGYLLSTQSDRMMMRHSVEGRFPFLDHRLIGFANHLDPRLKIRGLNEKFLLKKAMATRLPKDVLRRDKQPYRAPGAEVFFQAERPWIEDLLSPSALRRNGYFDADRVSNLITKLRRNDRPPSHRDDTAFSIILSTQAWHELFVSQRSLS